MPRSAATWWCAPASGSNRIRPCGKARASRRLISVSSQPCPPAPIRPIDSEKPPTVCTASRRKDMFAPIGLRITAVVVGCPTYEQPTTQPNSGGNQSGRRSAHAGTTSPPTPRTSGSS